MSDEIHMESAWRHRDMTAVEQWHGPQPDEALMAAEDLTGGLGLPARVAMMDRLMVYLFADEDPSRWEYVALRAHALMVHCAPHLLVCRGTRELNGLLRARGGQRCEGLADSTRLARTERNGADTLARLLEFMFPGTGSRWLFRGAQRAYILARAWQPWLVSRDGKELSYEDLAEVFEGEVLSWPEGQKVPAWLILKRNRARSRWSARVQEVLRKPIEAAGGKVRVQFSKSAGARGKMAASAKGNRNRRANWPPSPRDAKS